MVDDKEGVIPFSPPSSPQSRRHEVSQQETHRLGSETSLISDPAPRKPKESASNGKENAPPASSPINIPISSAKNQITPAMDSSSLNSLAHIPASKFLIGRSHYTSQPITIEYYVTERTVQEPTGPVKKQATTIRSIGDYQVVRTIGSGSTGKVKLAVDLRTQQKVAVKIISRKYINEPGKNSKETPASRKRRVLREAAILNLANHPNIVKLYDLYVTDEYYCMVFEYVDGGQMLDYIISYGKLAENQARKFFIQLLSAVAYCHANGIVHRDLKIENVLIDGNGDVKLVDFGLSNFYDPDAKLKTFCGSLYFAAPELLKGITYTGPEVDVWSLGIILFVLVAGKVPFDDKSLSALHEKIKSGKFAVPLHLTPECQNLLKVMIEVDPQKRATIAEIMAHPWTGLNGRKFSVNSAEPITNLSADIESFLIREFPYQFEEDEIRRTLQAAVIDWNRFCKHPIVALYHLVQLKQKQLAFNDGLACNHQAIEASPTQLTEDTFAPSSLPAAFHRKRADSLPTPIEQQQQKIPLVKSKRSASLQTEDALPNVIVEEPSMASSSASEGEEIKVKTVYLKGIFSVNTTSTKRPSTIRNLIMNCLTRLHGHEIIFLDRESYFICEYQAHSASIVDDDAGKAELCNDLDVSRLDLNDEPVSPNESQTERKLTFGALPGRSIRFEIHIVRVALLGLNGVQFKRISGDFGAYKQLCTRLIEEFNL